MTNRKSVIDEDLLDLQLRYGGTLQWLIPLLEEIQFLRETNLDADRVEYLTEVLESINATFDEET